MKIRQILPLLALGLCLAAPSRADLFLYEVNADLSAFSGSGSIGLSLNSFGTPDFNVVAKVSDLSLPGSTVSPGEADPAGDVVENGNMITFGGTATNRTFTIPVGDFGNSLSFFLELDRETGGTLDAWTFSLFAQNDEGSVFDALFLDLGPEGESFLFSSDAFKATVVPEPSTWAMLAAAVAGVAYRVRRRRA
ncbi:MAG: PEP-CTERM sorting domain-containing protein [Bryobacter sp.]|nr:PEP-CTERM sorting domain-containing protein [Bryobacter sp.]